MSQSSSLSGNAIDLHLSHALAIRTFVAAQHDSIVADPRHRAGALMAEPY
ncbi:hypothetical protein [Sphingomonas psychrotolerans]|nr:hypothetical protein [Sphingomonas psychrotolerans]